MSATATILKIIRHVCFPWPFEKSDNAKIWCWPTNSENADHMKIFGKNASSQCCGTVTIFDGSGSGSYF
jgi:hypothetical protein